MLAALLAWASALSFPFLSNRRQPAMAFPLAIATLMSAALTLVVVWDPPPELVSNKDRAVYEESFLRATISESFSDFEIGYALLEATLATVFSQPSVIFVVATLTFLLCAWALLAARYTFDDSAFLLFLTLNFFPFMLGALNVTRQFFAASILLFAYRFFQRAYRSDFKDRRSLFLFAATLIVASLFHRSALLVAPPFLLFLFGFRYRVVALVAVLLFALSASGASTFLSSVIFALDDRASSVMWSFERGDVGLVYTGGVNRLDFFAFTLAPVLIYAVTAGKAAMRPADDALISYYCCLMFPFFLLAFVPFSDRLALYAWLLWPVAASDRILRSSNLLRPAGMFVIAATIGAIAVFDLYGLTATNFSKLLLM